MQSNFAAAIQAAPQFQPRRLKLSMKPLTWRTRTFDRVRLSWLRREILPGPVILMYHGVVERDQDAELNRWNITCRELERHIRYLSDAFQIVSLDSLIDAIECGHGLPKNAVVITFDDALANVFVYARPILRTFAVPYVVAAPAGLIGSQRAIWSQEIRLVVLKSSCRQFSVELHGSKRHWRFDSRSTRIKAASQIVNELSNAEPEVRQRVMEEMLAQLPHGEFNSLLQENRDLRIMETAQLRQLCAEGVTIAAHGWLHVPLGEQVTDSVVGREVVDSKLALETMLQTPVDHFIFPYGRCVASSIQALRRAGYRSGLTTRIGYVQRSSNRFELPRISAECGLSHLRNQFSRLSA